MSRTIYREYCVCKKCGFGYANVKEHLCLTSLPPKYIAKYHCPACKFDGQVGENEVFRKEEVIGVDDGFTSDFDIAEPCPMPMQNSDDCNDPMPQKLVDDSGKEITLNGDSGNGKTISVEINSDTYLKDNSITTTPQIINDLIKCIKLMKFCGVNDYGALKDKLITQKEYDFMQKIFSKIEEEK